MIRKKTQIIVAAVAMLITFCANESYCRIININAGDNFFAPSNVSAQIGDTIQWTRIAGTHTTTCDGSQFTSRPSGAAPWDAFLSSGNLTFRYVITVSGTYNYKCTPHESEMRGVITATTSSITQITEMVNSFNLSQNYPNPFNPETKIKFSIPNSSKVNLKVYNGIGQEVAILINNNLNAGTYEVDWKASDFSSGVYYYNINAGEFTETKKMFLIK